MITSLNLLSCCINMSADWSKWSLLLWRKVGSHLAQVSSGSSQESCSPDSPYPAHIFFRECFLPRCRTLHFAEFHEVPFSYNESFRRKCEIKSHQNKFNSRTQWMIRQLIPFFWAFWYIYIVVPNVEKFISWVSFETLVYTLHFKSVSVPNSYKHHLPFESRLGHSLGGSQET